MGDTQPSYLPPTRDETFSTPGEPVHSDLEVPKVFDGIEEVPVQGGCLRGISGVSGTGRLLR